MLTRWLIGIAALLVLNMASAQRVTVVTEEYPPFNFSTEDKAISGLSTEIVKEVLRRAKIDYQLGIFTWARAYKMAQGEPNVLIYSIGRSQAREALFKWVDIIAPYNVYLYRLKSREDITGTTLEALKKYNFGAVRDDVRAQFLEKEGVKVDLVRTDALNVQKLALGRIELFPIDELGVVALYRHEQLDPGSVAKVLKLEQLSSGLYMAFSKATSDELVIRCKVALAEMKKDGTFEEIRTRYLK